MNTEYSKNIEYTIRKSARAKRLRLAVYCDGTVVLTTPVGTKASVIERFFEEKKQWVQRKLELFQSVDNTLLTAHSDDDYNERKDEARALVLRRARHYNKVLGVVWKDVVIKNQKTRWGSCSKKGNITINYKILYLPRKLQDYVIVHEMCHLKEFNHSKKFWRLLASVLPEWEEIKGELKSHGLLYQ
jgi:predicted metal-dependent hydrolase